MGNWFSNIQLLRNGAEDVDWVQRISALLMQKHGLRPAEQADADIELLICQPENSRWITLCSDLFEGDTEALLEHTKLLSREMETAAVAIACLDSDYLLLNLIDAPNKTDIWASCGRFPEGKAPRRSHFAAWKPYVTDTAAFRNAMRTRYLFAEDCLPAVQPLLSLPEAQGLLSLHDGADADNIFSLRFKYTEKPVSLCPPTFGKSLLCQDTYSLHHDNLINFLNQGEASQGVAVCLAGPCMTDDQAEVASICLQHKDSRGKWVHIPIELEKKTFADGIARLYGECPELRIPPAVPSNLPTKKQMDLVFQRTITVRFSLAPKESCTPPVLGDLHVILIPLKHFQGQYGVALKHR